MTDRPITKAEVTRRVRYIRRVLSGAEQMLRHDDWKGVAMALDQQVVPEAATIAGMIDATRLDGELLG
jgi:hypothetical protein